MTQSSFVYHSLCSKSTSWTTLILNSINWGKSFWSKRVSNLTSLASLSLYLPVVVVAEEVHGHKRRISGIVTPINRNSIDLGEERSSPGREEHVVGAGTACNVYNPLHFFSIWTESGTTTICVSVAVLLSSGVGADEYTTRVLEGEREPEVHAKCYWNYATLKWFTANICDMRKIEMKVITKNYLHLRIVWRDTVKKRVGSVESVARIALPLSVETHIIRRSPLGWIVSAARMIYTTAKAYEESYGVEQDCADFEIC